MENKITSNSDYDKYENKCHYKHHHCCDKSYHDSITNVLLQMQAQFQKQLQDQLQAQAQAQAQFQNQLQAQIQAQLQNQAQLQAQLQAQIQAQLQAQLQAQAQSTSNTDTTHNGNTITLRLSHPFEIKETDIQIGTDNAEDTVTS